MEFYDVIEKRESVRNYDPAKSVPRDVLERILNAGRLAPSAINNQPWRFLVISSPEMLKKVRPCYHSSWFKEAPHILVVVGDYNDAWVRRDGYNSLETDLAIAMDHLILAATNEGVATCWIAAFDPACLREALGLKRSEQVFAITPLGYPKVGYKSKEKKRKSLEEVAEFL